ncbi:MAG: DUF89 family protein [Dehalococcoidia bacterium]|nr:DUF89 family protein [Dehalococcoidia bacterium]
MKAREECYPCLARLARQAAELAADDEVLRDTAISEGLAYLEREFSVAGTSIAVATPIHRLVKSITGNPDPYRKVKENELRMARALMPQFETAGMDLRDCIVLAVRGNCIDFFMDLEQAAKDMRKPVVFALDDIQRVKDRLKSAKRMLYLADNAGEVLFDVPLVRMLQRHSPVTYVVKGAPVQDDATLEDMGRFGLFDQFPSVISTGTDTPGVVLEMASLEFRDAFRDSDLVLAKGMGYWETLSELPAEGKVFHVFKAKCRPVAESVGVNLDSFVAVLR